MIDFDTIIPQPSEEFVEPPAPDTGMVDGEYDEPDKSFIKVKRRKPHAVQYENKVRDILTNGWKILISNENTVPDAASIIMYGGPFSEAMGDWAAEDPKVRRAVDFVSGGTENPAFAAVAMALPLILQILRNHEPVAEVQPKKLRIPFLKRQFTFRFKFKLPKRIRNMTNDPKEFTYHVLGNPEIQAELKKQGIKIG